MLNPGWYFSDVKDYKKRADKKQNVETDKILSQNQDIGSTWNMLASLGLRLIQHCQLLTLAFLLKKEFFEEELLNIAIDAEV